MKLGRVRGLGPKKIQQLVETFGSLEKLFDAAPDELISTRVFKSDMLPEWQKLKDASEENFNKVIEDCASNGIGIVPIIDKAYPPKLKKISASPLTLFLWGDASLLEKEKIAIVGTREPSEKAKKMAFDFSKNLSGHGIIIVSGGAEGIDTEAHRGALAAKNGKTICVFGTGFFRPYPQKNIPLFDEIRKSGGLLVSEHLPNFPGSAISLAGRNRITSGISDAIFVCASKETGGAMVQTKVAWEQRIPIFCPVLSLDIQPNAGTRIAIESFGAREVKSPDELVTQIREHPSLQNYP